MSQAPKPLAELVNYVRTFSARCRAARWFGALFHVGVCEDILADAVQEQRQIATHATAAERDDRAALKLLEDAAQNGLQDSDMEAIAKAIRLIRRSADSDRDIAAAARV